MVDSSGNINSANFTHWESIAASEFPNGVVFYLPNGHFSSDFTTYTGVPGNYQINSHLTINLPKIQLVGDGHGVTSITDNTPTDYGVVLDSGSTGSGIFGLSINYSSSASTPNPPGPATTYDPPIQVQNTTQVRLAGIICDYSMGGIVGVLNSTNSDIYNFYVVPAFNNTQPTVPLGLFTLTATSPNATSDIRLYQMDGGGFDNIWNGSAYVNDTGLPESEIPEMDYIRIVGGVQRTRIDHCSIANCKNGVVPFPARVARPPTSRDTVSPRITASMMRSTSGSFREHLTSWNAGREQ